MNKQQSCVIAEVEDFIKQLHDGDIAIASEVRKWKFETPKKGALGLPSKRVKSFGDLLGWAIATYQLRKDLSPDSSIEIAYECLDYIERARVYGAVKPVKLTNQLKECREQNQRLKDNQQKLEEDFLRLKIENEKLHKALDRFVARGDVVEE